MLRSIGVGSLAAHIRKGLEPAGLRVDSGASDPAWSARSRPPRQGEALAGWASL